MMRIKKKNLIQIIICSLFLYSCAYIVTPAVDVTPTSTTARGWTAVASNVSQSAAGDLHIDLAIRNETNDWSKMEAATGRPATLVTGGNKSSNCDTVFVSTGGNSLAPGFQIRGYTGGTQTEPKTQLLYVECKGVTAAPGSTLTIDYTYVTGPYNYYVSAKSTSDKLVVNLDEVASDLKYPIAAPIEGLVEKAGAKIVAINDCILTLTSVKRTDTGLELGWETDNPGAYPTYVHIGFPPVIGTDGIIYGFYRDPTLADAPITLPAKKANWTTAVIVPADVQGLYILASVETKQQKNFTSHVIDITDK
jgi:hypothetical protein